jgi:hypothetical protein
MVQKLGSDASKFSKVALLGAKLHSQIKRSRVLGFYQARRRSSVFRFWVLGLTLEIT